MLLLCCTKFLNQYLKAFMSQWVIGLLVDEIRERLCCLSRFGKKVLHHSNEVIIHQLEFLSNQRCPLFGLEHWKSRIPKFVY